MTFRVSMGEASSRQWLTKDGEPGFETLTGDIHFSSEAVKSEPAPTLAPTPKARLELRLVGSGPGPGLSEMRDLGPSQPVFVSSSPVITNADIAHARATRHAGAPAVGLAFTKRGADTLCDITSANIGKPMGVLVDGKLVNVATIRERLTCGAPGRALITGDFSHDEAKRIAATFPAEPADPLTINSVWQGTGQQSKPALTYSMILFVQQRSGHIEVSPQVGGVMIGSVGERRAAISKAVSSAASRLLGSAWPVPASESAVP